MDASERYKIMFAQNMFLIPSASLTSITSASFLANGTSSSISFGTADSDRYIVAVASLNSTSPGTFSSFTIGGVAATILGQATETASFYSAVCIAIAPVPTGTSGTIGYSYSGSGVDATGYATYRVISPERAPILLDAGIDNNPTSGNLLTLDLDTQEGGLMVAGVFVGNGGSTWEWSGLTTASDYTDDAKSSEYYSGTHVFPLISSDTPASLAADNSGTNDSCSGVSVCLY